MTKLTMTFEFDETDSLPAEFLRALADRSPRSAETKATPVADALTAPLAEVEKPKRKRGRPRKVKVEEPVVDEAEAPSVEDVKAAVKRFVEAHDVDAAKAIFAAFGAKKISDLPTSAYAEVVAKLDEGIGDGIPF